MRAPRHRRYSVTRRTHEIGIRLALGGQRSRVTRLILRKGLALTLIVVIALSIKKLLTLLKPCRDILKNEAVCELDARDQHSSRSVWRSWPSRST
jgi:hypothetical protein